MGQLNVGPQAISVTTSQSQYDIFGQNLGTVPIYLSELPDVSPTNNSLVLAKGNTFTWPSGKQLYACTGTGQNSILTYTNNGATMGLSNVNVAGTVGTIGQNNPINLGQGGTATLVGAQSLVALNVPSGIPTKGFASIIIAIGDDANYNGGLALANWCTLNIVQTLNNITVATYTPQWLLGGILQGYIQIPVIGDTLNISGSFSKAASGTPDFIYVQVIGSSEDIQNPRYLNQNVLQGGDIPSGGAYSLNTSATNLNFIATKNGPASLHVLAGTGTSNGSANIQYVENGTQHIFAGTGAIGVGLAAELSLILPMFPIMVSVAPSAGNLFASLTQ